MYKYFPHTDADIRAMLQKVAVEKLDDLYAELPDAVRLKKEYDLPSSMTETEVRNYFKELGALNSPLVSFAGGGVYAHYSPAVIPQLLSRSEFLTAYTPYQPEISQGTLQYIFEFQSMIAELTGMDCSNASMYDGATATAEAMFMAVAHAKKKNRVLISQTVAPHVRRVVNTYAKFKGIEVGEIAEKDGITDLNDMQQKLAAGDVAGVIVSSPNFYGIVEDYTGVADRVHEAKALLIMNADPSALSILKTPREWGADIACGDGQTLGIPMNFGGPFVGYLASTKELMRKLPGRIVGATTDVDGKRAFVLTLQAREQHIRREKANSNICSNQSLMALYVTIYLALMGKEGLRKANELSYAGAHYLCDELLKTGKFELCFDRPFFKEFAVRTTLDVDRLYRRCIENGILAGIRLGDTRPEMKDVLMFSVTEKRTREEIERLMAIVREEATR